MQNETFVKRISKLALMYWLAGFVVISCVKGNKPSFVDTNPLATEESEKQAVVSPPPSETAASPSSTTGQEQGNTINQQSENQQNPAKENEELPQSVKRNLIITITSDPTLDQLDRNTETAIISSISSANRSLETLSWSPILTTDTLVSHARINSPTWYSAVTETITNSLSRSIPTLNKNEIKDFYNKIINESLLIVLTDTADNLKELTWIEPSQIPNENPLSTVGSKQLWVGSYDILNSTGILKSKKEVEVKTEKKEPAKEEPKAEVQKESPKEEPKKQQPETDPKVEECLKLCGDIAAKINIPANNVDFGCRSNTDQMTQLCKLGKQKEDEKVKEAENNWFIRVSVENRKDKKCELSITPNTQKIPPQTMQSLMITATALSASKNFDMVSLALILSQLMSNQQNSQVVTQMITELRTGFQNACNSCDEIELKKGTFEDLIKNISSNIGFLEPNCKVIRNGPSLSEQRDQCKSRCTQIGIGESEAVKICQNTPESMCPASVTKTGYDQCMNKCRDQAICAKDINSCNDNQAKLSCQSRCKVWGLSESESQTVCSNSDSSTVCYTAKLKNSKLVKEAFERCIDRGAVRERGVKACSTDLTSFQNTDAVKWCIGKVAFMIGSVIKRELVERVCETFYESFTCQVAQGSSEPNDSTKTQNFEECVKSQMEADDTISKEEAEEFCAAKDNMCVAGVDNKKDDDYLTCTKNCISKLRRNKSDIGDNDRIDRNFAEILCQATTNACSTDPRQEDLIDGSKSVKEIIESCISKGLQRSSVNKAIATEQCTKNPKNYD